ncbi:MAG: glycosyltransferase family 39 protein [Cytophagaceae bacterium]|nr:glycosyltransferase family 39 protein [Cytophagaceae bacterium]
MNEPAPRSDFWFYSLVFAGILLNATGLVPPIMEPDGALYATIAKTMAQTGDFVNLMVRGEDWLDKPHFPFWVTALSYRLFGINSFAYKFPAFLFWLAGVAYTYRFARLVYPKIVAQVAMLVVLTPYHLVLSNNDVRAEPYLTGLVIGSVYHFFRVFQGGQRIHLVLGALLTACALMTKGPFVLVPIGAGLVLHWVLKGQWRELLRPRWYLALALTLLFTLPELYCLYQQFDVHPEKVVFGQTGVSGVRFFFWDSQFGRFFNTGPIRGAGDPAFFLHTLLWAFLPWSLLLYAAVGRNLWRIVKRQSDQVPEYVSLGSGLATFLLFSLSSFQLPHYLNIVFPFYAILTAHFLVDLRSAKALRAWSWAQTFIGILLGVLAVFLLVLFRPEGAVWAGFWIVLTAVATIWLFRGATLPAILGRTVGASVLLYGFLNLFLFPDMLQYQAGMKAAAFLNNQNSGPVGVYGEGSFAFEFYLHRPLIYHNDSTLRVATARQPVRIFTSAKEADSLRRNGFSVNRLATFHYFHVSQPSLEFLNHQTRASVLEPYAIIELRVEN